MSKYKYVLFTKRLCSACQEAKAVIAERGLGDVVRVVSLDPINEKPMSPDAREALGELAWYEVVEDAETSLPVLCHERWEGRLETLVAKGQDVVNVLLQDWELMTHQREPLPYEWSRALPTGGY